MNDSAYWDWFHRGVEATNAARLTEAEQAFAYARVTALRHRLPLVDRAYCNWAAVRYLQHRTTGLEKGLSRVLGGSEDPQARRLAAFHMATLYFGRKNLKSAKFYGEMAVRLAEDLEVVPGQIASRHLLSLMCLSESRFEEAAVHLEQALALDTPQELPHTVMTKSTLGYCQSLQGRQNEGVRLLEEALDDMAGLGCWVYELTLRLNLGFSLLEKVDLDGAIAQGEAALRLLEARDPEAKFVYYLLGEGHAQRGAVDEAEEYFETLQKTYYPQYPGLAQVLLACRTAPLVNWLAK